MAAQYPGGVHPFADSFPLLTGTEFADLVESIENRGLVHKIVVTHDGILVDGRNRWAALEALGVPIDDTVREVLPEDTSEEFILEFIVSSNMHRRHLNASQKAILGAELEARLAAAKGETPVVRSARRDSDRHANTTAARAAALTGASESYVERAKRVMRDAPELVPEVRAGKMTLSGAATRLKDKPKQATSARGYRMPERPMVDSVNKALSTLNGLCIAIGGVQEVDPHISAEQRADWEQELTKHIRTLTEFRRKLKEEN